MSCVLISAIFTACVQVVYKTMSFLYYSLALPSVCTLLCVCPTWRWRDCGMLVSLVFRCFLVHRLRCLQVPATRFVAWVRVQAYKVEVSARFWYSLYIPQSQFIYFTNKSMLNNWQVKKKKINFATSKVKKKFNLTIDLLSLGVYAPGPQVLTYRSQILREIRIWTPFRVPGPERRVKRFRCFRNGRG